MKACAMVSVGNCDRTWERSVAIQSEGQRLGGQVRESTIPCTQPLAQLGREPLSDALVGVEHGAVGSSRLLLGLWAPRQ